MKVVQDYKDVLVNKPWGYEYLCYQNEELAIWFLHIAFDQQTSFHCHPNKNTGFVVLDGQVELSFMRNSIQLSAMDKIHIFRSRFHSTKALSKDGAYILEIETPEDKHDLVRLEDSYGRESTGYEGVESFVPKQSDCFWIPEPSKNPSPLFFKSIFIEHMLPLLKEDLMGFEEADTFIVAKGGIQTHLGQKVIWPGDVVDGISIERLLNSFELAPETSVIRIGNASSI
jgi:mannose-6-phosphate isomerase-like protein (cupin superfamily)